MLLLGLLLRREVVLFRVDLVLVIILKDTIFLVSLIISNRCYAFWVGLVALVLMQNLCSFSLFSHLTQLLLQLSNFFLCLVQLLLVLIDSLILCTFVVLTILTFYRCWHLSSLHCFLFLCSHSLDNFMVIRLLSFLDATHGLFPPLFVLHAL